MKKIFFIISVCSTLFSCKKDNSPAISCNRVATMQALPGNGNTVNFIYTYNKEGKVNTLIERAGSTDYKYEYTYENGGLRILVNSFNTPALKDSFELNSDGYIIYWVHHFGDGTGYFYYTYDGNGFLASQTTELFLNGKPVSAHKDQIVHTNTVVNGNLVKRVSISKDLKTGISGMPETSTWEYDESKAAFPEFISPNHAGYEFLGRGHGKSSKNAAVKYNRNGVEYNYTYSLDSNGRLAQIIGINIGGGSSYSNQKFTYTYSCN